MDRYVNVGVDRPGGMTLNFAVHARRAFPHEDSIEVIAPVGTDPEAEIVLKVLEERGLPHVVMRREGATPVQYIDHQPDGEKIFFRYEAGVLEEIRLGEREQSIVATADLLMTPLYRQVENLFDSVMSVPFTGHRAVDFTNLSDHDPRPLLVEKYIDGFTIGFFGLNASEADLITTLERIARANRKLFVVTLGAEGSVTLGDFGRLACPAVSVKKVVDTTGAGDTFAAGFLSEYVHTGDVEAALRKGSLMAAETVQRIGAF